MLFRDGPQGYRPLGSPLDGPQSGECRFNVSIKQALKAIPGIKPAAASLRALLASTPPLRPFLTDGSSEDQWARIVQNQETRRLMRRADPTQRSALEISGTRWSDFGFRSYKSVAFPEYDVCDGPLPGETFDAVMAEQVFEHLLWPYRAARNVYAMLNPGGVLLLTTPFLVKIHPNPTDCSRWTETGIKYLLAEAGFDLDKITTGSWGNRACVKANWPRWQTYQPWRHSLRNEPDFPIVVWAIGTK
jgi:hypothetical protein